LPYNGAFYVFVLFYVNELSLLESKLAREHGQKVEGAPYLNDEFLLPGGEDPCHHVVLINMQGRP